MRQIHFVKIAILLLFIMMLPLSALAKENLIPERPDPKDVVNAKLIDSFIYFPLEIKKKYSGKAFFLKLRVEVSENGSVKEVSVKESSGYRDLDDVVILSARNFLFTPTYIRGKPIKTLLPALPLKIIVPEYRLHDK